MSKTLYTERRLYFFTCEGCGTPNRQSFKRRKVKVGICRSCKRKRVPENQIPLL